MGNVFSDDYAFYPKQNKGSDLYSSIASDVGLEVDEKDYDILVPAHKPQIAEERKEEEVYLSLLCISEYVLVFQTF